MEKIGAFFSVLRNGSMLTDPATWKVRQNLINALVGTIGAAAVLLPMFGVKLEVSGDDALAIAGGIAAVAGLFINPYLTTATTDKIGLQPERETDN